MSAEEVKVPAEEVAKIVKEKAMFALMLAGEFKFHVFPLREGMKTPATSHGFKNSVVDKDSIVDIWRDKNPGANIGVRTGWKSGGLVVIDLDLPKHDGDIAGEFSLAKLEAKLGKLPATLTAKTPSGGTHLYFYMSPEYPFPTICEDFGGKGSCIDIRGEGGYVVAPASITEAGKYEFTGQGADGAPVATLPTVWQDALRKGMTTISVSTEEELATVRDLGSTAVVLPLDLARARKESPAGNVLEALAKAVGGADAPFQGKLFEDLIAQFGADACEREFGKWETTKDGKTPKPNAKFSELFAAGRPKKTSSTGSTSNADSKTNTSGSSTGNSGKKRRKKQGETSIEAHHVENWLSWISPPKDRATWLKVGMALHDWDNGATDGLEIWDKWSEVWWDKAQGERDKKKLEAQYNAFRGEKDDSVTEVSLYHLAKEGVVENLNQRLAVRQDATTSEFYERIPGEVLAVKPDKLMLEYANKPLYVLNEDGEPKKRNPFEFWCEAPGRRSVVGMTAHIDHTKTFIRGADGFDRMNVWAGLPEKGTAGKAEAFKKFVKEVICADRDDLYTWFWNWVAYKAQNPLSVSKAACIIYGPKGTGKNLLFEYLRKAFGEGNCVLFDTKAQLEAKHNTMRVGKIIECSDEVLFMQDPREENKMKPLITQEKIIVEPKHAKQFEAPKFSMWLIFTNDNRPLRVTDDERRYTFMKTDSKYSPGVAGQAANIAYYHPVYEELENGGPSSLLAELLATDLTNFSPFPGHETEEMRKLMQETDKGEDEWFNDIVESGFFPIPVTELKLIHGTSVTAFSKTSAQDFALLFCRKYGGRPRSGMASQLLKKQLELEDCGRGKTLFSLPPLPDLRARWLKMYPKSSGFRYRKDWENESWEFAARGVMKEEEKKVFMEKILEGEYNTPFATEKPETLN